MSWPLSQDYNEAIQSPASNFADADLKKGQAVANALGLPMPYSGNFADVYQVRCPDGSRWAVKCFTREVHGLRERYQEISAHLKQAKLPFTVDFTYLEKGIGVAGKWHPVLKMQWVEGLTLNQFVGKCLDKPAMLESLCQIWTRMAARLRAADMAHGDLQHGNILLAPGTGAGSLALKLIDYDGMWIPSLAKIKSGEVGHPNYQHPQRGRDGIYNAEVDRFPLLLIATALRALTVKGKALWEKYNNDDNLLFTEVDLRDPYKSELFRELANMNDLTTAMTVRMRKSLAGGLESAPLLEDLAPESRATAPAKKSLQNSSEQAGLSRRDRANGGSPRTNRGLPVGLIAAAAAALVVVLGGAAGAVYFATRGGSDKAPTKSAVELAVVPSQQVVEPEKEPVEPVGDPSPNPEKNSSEKSVDIVRGPESAVKPSEEIDDNPKGPVGLVRLFEAHSDVIRKLAVSPDGRRLLTAGFDKTIRLWDVANGRELLKWEGPVSQKMHGVAFLPDGKRALSCCVDDKAVHLWDLSDGHEIRSYEGHTEGIWYIAVSGDGRFAASSSDKENTAFIWDVETGKALHRLEGNTGGVESLAFSSDGTLLLTGSCQGSMRLWEVETGKEVRRFQGHSGLVTGVAFSPDGKLVYSCGIDKTVCVWQVDDGREVRQFEGVTSPVWCVVVSKDGRRVLTGHEDGTLHLWEAATGKELYALTGSTAHVWTGAFSPDARYAFSGGDNVARMWRLPPADYVPARVAETASPVVKKSEPKPTAPDAAALAAADKEFKDVHKAEYAKKKPADLQALAAKLLQEGIDTKDKPAVRFALLRGARDLAAKVGDFTLALRAADEMANLFDVDAWEMKLQAVEAGARAATTRSANLRAAEAALALAEESIDGDEFERAERAIKIALEASKATDNAAVRAVVDERLGEIEALRKAYEPVKAALKTLAGKPDDAAANLALGTYLCLNKGDWSRGLPALAQGADPKWKALATADLSCAADPDAQVEMAKKYLTQADGESGATRAYLQRRACYWYQKAEAKLTGISKAEAIKKVADIAKLLPNQRPAIVCAFFGTSNEWNEATEKVRSLLLPAKGRNQLVMAGHDQLGVSEPGIPQNKTMVIVYQVSGQTCLSITPEGTNATIPAPPGAQDTGAMWPTPGQELMVLAARYGSEGTWADVTSQVQHLVKGRSLTVTAGDEFVGDPFPGKSKTLFIVYRYHNRVRLAITAQGQTAVLGAAPAKP